MNFVFRDHHNFSRRYLGLDFFFSLPRRKLSPCVFACGVQSPNSSNWLQGWRTHSLSSVMLSLLVSAATAWTVPMMVYFIHRGVRGRQARQIVAGSFSVVSTPNFAMKASVESSRRDLHNTEFLWEFVRKVLQLREVAASFALAREYWCGFHAPVAFLRVLELSRNLGNRELRNRS